MKRIRRGIRIKDQERVGEEDHGKDQDREGEEDHGKDQDREG